MTYEFMQGICLNALLFVLLLSLTMVDWTEAAVGRCSSKSPNIHKKTPVLEFFLIKLQARWLVLIWVKSLLKKGPPLPKICHTYPTTMKFGTVIPYPKKIQKIYESRDTPLVFCWHQHFFTGNHQILLYQEIRI